MKAQPPAAIGLPAEFVNRLEEVVPQDQIASVLRSFERPGPPVFRINTLRASETSLLEELMRIGLAVRRLPTEFPAFSVPASQRRALTHSEAAVEGRLYVQGVASMLAAVALAPCPGEEVLDLAAAPGGKTLLLACLMGNQGRIAAVESVRARFFRLRANVSNHGASIVDMYLRDGAGVWRQCPERFDRVLLDAPCSSEARFSLEDPASFAYWSPRKVKEMSRKQRRLLYSAVQSTKPGGVVVYSTCAFAPEENELVIDGALRRFGGALLVEPLRSVPGRWQPGLTKWRNATLEPSLATAVRVLPGELAQAAFVCRLRKLESTVDPAPRSSVRISSPRARRSRTPP